MRFRDIAEAIGHTPLVEMANISPKKDVHIFAKLEGHNPTGSVKDRIAKYMLDEAEASGKLTKDRIILEPTSGNTGIAIAMLGHRSGYRVKVAMPDNVSEERRHLLELYGAEIVLSEGRLGTNGTIALAKEMAAADPTYFMPYQYGNPANPLAHYETTGPEIIADLPDVDVFIAGMGTGGTLMGTGRRLKEHNRNVKVIAVEPHPGELVQGLRSLDEGFIPPIVDLRLLDGKMVVRSHDAFVATKMLTEREGIFAGISSGAVVQCAIRVARRMEKGNIVVLLADGGWKYLSTGLWTRKLEEIEKDMEDKLWW
ncbi:MAG: cysteine synthase family protein [Chloroflexi bacterium]|nr:cysteine synthase family protein [Chloroflexota bacterium]